MTLTPDSSARVLTVNAAITTAGGAINLTAANPNNVTAQIINALLNTSGGVGVGTLTVGGGIQLNVAPLLGAGNITLQGNGLDLTLSTVSFSSSVAFAVNRYLIVNGAVTTTNGANISLTGDASQTGVGGVFITTTGSINSSGNVTLSGSNLAGLSGATAGVGVEIQSGASVTAAGDVSLVASTSNANLLVNGPVQSTGTGNVSLSTTGSGAISVGANIVSHGGAISFTGATSLLAPVTVNAAMVRLPLMGVSLARAPMC